MANNSQCHNFLTQPLSRRAMLQQSSVGFGSLALAGLLQEQIKNGVLAADAGQAAAAPKSARFPARAKRIIFMFFADLESSGRRSPLESRAPSGVVFDIVKFPQVVLLILLVRSGLLGHLLGEHLAIVLAKFHRHHHLFSELHEHGHAELLGLLKAHREYIL